VVFEFNETGSHQFTTFIVPANEGQSIAVDQRIEGRTGHQGFQVTSGSVSDVLLIGESAKMVRYKFLRTAARVAWARFDSEDFVRAFLIQGHRFETTNGFGFRSAAPINHCSIRRIDGGSEWLIDGVAPFQLKSSECCLNLEVNGTAFEVSQPIAKFAGSEMPWKASENSSEAIN